MAWDHGEVSKGSPTDPGLAATLNAGDTDTRLVTSAFHGTIASAQAIRVSEPQTSLQLWRLGVARRLPRL